jgi:hypothetical protein
MILRSLAVTSTLLLRCTSFLSAQQPKVLAPHKPVAPLVTPRRKLQQPSALHSMVGGLWMTDANFKSTIYLRNDVGPIPSPSRPFCGSATVRNSC